MRLKKGDWLRVWALARVSTTAQANVEHGSLEQQKNMMKRWAQEQTNKTGTTFDLRDEHIIEEDISGRASSVHKRTGLNSIRRAIRQGECDVLVIEKIDRLARDQNLARTILQEAADHGVLVYEIESGLIDMRDRGSRLGFNIKNMMAEEYSLDLEEKITKKLREAMVNNGKGVSTCAVLGLDPHPVRAGFYVKVPEEIVVVQDIYEQFCILRSYTALAEYCSQKGYRSKPRIIKEKIVRGERVAARKVGGETMCPKYLRALLTNPKLHGGSSFKDTWNQFPQLQDEDQNVRWEYAHGPVIDKALCDRVMTTIREIEGQRLRISESRGVYLLSGVLVDANGNKFYGSRAKAGQFHYYVCGKTGARLPADLMDDVVIKRVKEYLQSSDLMRGILETALKHQNVGLPAIDAEMAKIKGRIKNLEDVVERFSTSLRESALSGVANIPEVCAALLGEKKKAQADLAAEQAKLDDFARRRERIKNQQAGRTIETYLQQALAKFDEKSDLMKKRIVQAIVPQVIVKSEEEIVLMINPEPSDVCHIGGKEVVLKEEERDGRDLNPRPPA